MVLMKCMVMLVVLVAIISSLMGPCSGEVYTVGDEQGWTVGTNYTEWATSKTFKHGDTIVFNYDSGSHNVFQVSRNDYHTCNSDAPLAVHNSGNDTIFVKKRKGHYYFICGIPGHCKAGQKVDIRIPLQPSTDSNVNPSSLISPSPAISLAPAPNSSDDLVSNEFGHLVVGVLVALVAPLFFS